MLSAPGAAPASYALGAPRVSLDAAGLAAVEQAAAEAYERGRRDGAHDAEAAVAAQVARGVEAVSAGLAEVGDDLRALVSARAQADTELALAIAEAVLGREPSPTSHDLATRLRLVLAQVDDAGVVIEVHPDDHGVVAEMVGARSGVAVHEDSSMPAGEARLDGRFARALLTRTAALDAVRDALALDEADPSADSEAPSTC